MKYKLRAECQFDIDVFIKIADLKEYKIIESAGLPDCKLEFESDKTIDDLVLLMEGIPDSHVMSETLQELDSYTGIRI